MILEEETFKKFGYYPKDLKPQSHKRIIVKCDECGIIREIYKYRYFSLCRSCGLKTRKSSEETKQKIREALEGKHRSEKTKEKIRNTLEGKYCGEDSPSWKGGISYEPYCILFNIEFKERVREFWNRKCVVCGKSEIEDKRKLDVHHVNYNKETCCDDSIPLFVILCRSCHVKTNSNRKYWEDEFKRIIYSKNISGKCFYTIDEMKKNDNI